jgi:hypothetical protein
MTGAGIDVVGSESALAEKVGRDAARKEHSELVIKDERGRIQDKDSHGHDPRRTKG